MRDVLVLTARFSTSTVFCKETAKETKNGLGKIIVPIFLSFTKFQFQNGVMRKFFKKRFVKIIHSKKLILYVKIKNK